MPLSIEADVVSTVLLVPADGSWMERLRAGLGELSRGPADRDQREHPDAFRVAMHLDALEERRDGRLSWETALARNPLGSVAASYLDMLEIGGRIPRYAWGPIHVSVDLFDPERRAAAWGSGLEAIEVLASSTQLYPWARGSLNDGTPIRPNDLKSWSKMAVYGEAYGAAVAVVARALEADFGFGDLGALIRAAAKSDAAPWERLWPITWWSGARLAENPGLAEKAAITALTPDVIGRAEPFERAACKAIVHDGEAGRLFQYRTIFGGRGRSAAVDRAIAGKLGLAGG